MAERAVDRGGDQPPRGCPDRKLPLGHLGDQNPGPTRPHGPVSVRRWRQYVLSLAGPVAGQPRELLAAQGCVLAETVRTPHPLPPYEASAMDGYAVRSADVADACEERPARLRVIDSAPAGRPATHAIGPDQAVRILTGGMLPPGADAVVPVEATDAGRSVVAVSTPATPGRHIRRAGEDAPAGAVVLSKGAVVSPGIVAAAVAAGRSRLSVVPPPQVLVISTGDELVAPGRPLGAGLVPDSNGAGLAASVRALGAGVCGVLHCRDDPTALRRLLDEHAGRADVVVTTGGVSAGAENDVVRAALKETGHLRFGEVAMRPGSPQAAGFVGGRPIVALPGNPVAAAVSFAVFVRPLLRRMRGLRPLVDWRTAPLGADVTSAVGRTQFLLGYWGHGEDGMHVIPHPRSGSHLVTGLADAHVLIAVPPGEAVLPAGTRVTILPLTGCPDDSGRLVHTPALAPGGTAR